MISGSVMRGSQTSLARNSRCTLEALGKIHTQSNDSGHPLDCRVATAYRRVLVALHTSLMILELFLSPEMMMN